jgi:hypothetical protein
VSGKCCSSPTIRNPATAREQRYRPHRKRATASMPWLCSAQPLRDHKQRRIPCPVSNDQPTAVRTIASALQFEHSLRAQSRQEHHARRPSRATAMRPGAIVRVRTRFDVQRRLPAQIPTAPLCADSAHVPERRACRIAANDPAGAEAHTGLELPPGTDENGACRREPHDRRSVPWTRKPGNGGPCQRPERGGAP